MSKSVSNRPLLLLCITHIQTVVFMKVIFIRKAFTLIPYVEISTQYISGIVTFSYPNVRHTTTTPFFGVQFPYLRRVLHASVQLNHLLMLCIPVNLPRSRNGNKF